MYTSFFGLNEKPFAITPDPRYLFMSARHGEGLAHLLYGVTDSGGFIQLTGEVGTGKTTLVRSLLGQLPAEVDVALILNPRISVLEFLQSICHELRVPPPTRTDSAMALVDALNRFLLDAHAKGRRIILLVDEAQNLSTEVLEQLRLLTNLETSRQKLLQIILIGQPELRDILARNELRQLAQRVTGRYHLEPLSRDETVNYVEHRLAVAGAVGEVFNAAAKREVHRLSGGIPRLINVICDRALLGAYSREVRVVDKSLVRRAAEEVSGGASGAGIRRTRWRWAAGASVLAALGVGYAAATLFGMDQDSVSAADAGQATQLAMAELPEPVAATETPSVDNAPDVTTEHGPDLDLLLANGNLHSNTDSAMRRLLARWGIDVQDTESDFCERAESGGLSCLWQRGSWRMLEQLDRPAILTLTDSRGETHDVLLSELRNGEATLAFDERTATFPVDQVAGLWFGKYLMLWRPPAGTANAIVPGSRGPDVVWLKQSLAALNGEDLQSVPSADDFFDSALEAKVRDFQRRNRLQVDGLAGEQTQIIINSGLARDDSPRLSGDT